MLQSVGSQRVTHDRVNNNGMLRADSRCGAAETNTTL